MTSSTQPYPFSLLVHHTTNAAIARGGDKINIIPGQLTLMFDGRTVPGCAADDILAVFRARQRAVR